MAKFDFDLSIYGVLDLERTRARPLGVLAEAAILGGVTFLQLRAKNFSTREMLAAALEVSAVTRKHSIPLVINDRADIAYAVEAEGVHLGQKDMHSGEARDRLGDFAIIGATIHSLEEARNAPVKFADYYGVGAVYATASKDRAIAPIGVEGFAEICCELARIDPGKPVVGIGGITDENCTSVMAAGAQGVAVISDIFMADDVEAAARRLATAIYGDGEEAV